MKKKSTLVMTANLQGTDQTKFNLEGSGIKFVRIPKIPVVKKNSKRNIYA
jgi:hypothetical protein